MKVIAWLIGNLTNDVCDICIVPALGTFPIESSPRRYIGNTNVAPAVETADQRHRAIAANELKASFWNAQAAPCSEPQRGDLGALHGTPIVARGEFRDPQFSVPLDARFRPRAPERTRHPRKIVNGFFCLLRIALKLMCQCSQFFEFDQARHCR